MTQEKRNEGSEHQITKIEDRLRSLELQTQKNSTHIEAEVGNLIKLTVEIRDLIKHHETLFFGNNGNPGLVTRLDRLEQADSSRRWGLRAVITLLIGLIVKALWEVILHH